MQDKRKKAKIIPEKGNSGDRMGRSYSDPLLQKRRMDRLCETKGMRAIPMYADRVRADGIGGAGDHAQYLPYRENRVFDQRARLRAGSETAILQVAPVGK